MTDRTTGRGGRVLLIDPAARDARAVAEGRLMRLLVVGALASFLGFFGLAVIGTPPSTTGEGVQASSSSFVVTRGGDDDDEGFRLVPRSQVRTRSS